MAGPFTHFLVCQAASDSKFVETLGPALPTALRDLLRDYQDFVLLGSVGPDLPAVHDKFASERWSDEFHNGATTNATVLNAYSDLKAVHCMDARLAFLLGYVGHMVTDAVIHPIVGLANPTKNSTVHRECEICQDTLLFKARLKSDLTRAAFIDWLERCKDDDPGVFDQVMAQWERAIKKAYPTFPNESKTWFTYYTDAIEVAEGFPLKFNGYTYQEASKISASERSTYYDNVLVPVPEGRRGNFYDEGFIRSVRNVLKVWLPLFQRYLDPANHNPINDLVPRWNLDNGTNMDTQKPNDLWS